jgi:hypothetical protein
MQIRILPGYISPEQSKDTGMAMVLLCLIAGLAGGNQLFFKIAIGLLLIDMIWPKIFFPVAVVWFGFANIMSGIVSKIILTIIFFLVVTPIGLLKRRTGPEPLRLKEWKRNKDSVFAVRNRSYSARDFEKPY